MSERTPQQPERPRGHRLKRLGLWLKGHRLHLKVLGRVLIVSAAAVALVAGLFTLRTRPSAEAFTRVGGSTSVETAVEASRFWLSPPQSVVETPIGASQQVMLWAAQCAVVLDAPLLLTSPDPARQRLVNSTLGHWKEEDAAAAFPVTILSQSDMRDCLAGHRAHVSGLSTLAAFDPILRPPLAQQGDKLAPVVVFAAAWAPDDSPDVAVGLALAAHMARSGQQVSLVVVPRYLEADHQLEKGLHDQRQTITGGVVLGETPTVPDDTSTLLRQLLVSPDRLSDVVGKLTGSIGLVVALLGLLGLLAVEAPQIGETVVLLFARSEEKRREREGPEPSKREPLPGVGTGKSDPVPPKSSASDASSGSAPRGDWATDLNGQAVTVWLRSGTVVTGAANGLHDAAAIQGTGSALTVLRLNGAKVERVDDDQPQEPGSALIPVAGIDVVGFKPQEPSAPESSPASQTPGPPETSTAAAGANDSSSAKPRWWWWKRKP